MELMGVLRVETQKGGAMSDYGCSDGGWSNGRWNRPLGEVKRGESPPLCPLCGSELTFPGNRRGMTEIGGCRCYCPKCNCLLGGARASKTVTVNAGGES